MLALEPDVVLALDPGIVLHSLPDQGWFFAFNVATGDQFTLNRTSYWVLEAIGCGTKWADLKDSFLSAFEVDAKQGEVDLKKLVSDFHEQRIIGRNGDGKEQNPL